MRCLCNFFENNECLIWIIIALIVLSSFNDSCGCGCGGGCGCDGSARAVGNCGCGCGCG